MDPKISSCQCRRVVFGSHFVFNSRREDSNMVFSKMRSTILFWEIPILLALIYEVGGDIQPCPPGTHRNADWKEGDSQPRCIRCPDNTFSSIKSIATACEDCMGEGECPSWTVFKNSCNATTNNHCECREGSYLVPIPGGFGRCYKHSTCSEGQIVVKEGTPNEDTVCGPKPTGPTSPGAEKDSNGKAHSGSDRSFRATGESHVLRQYGQVAIIAIISIASIYLFLQHCI